MMQKRRGSLFVKWALGVAQADNLGFLPQEVLEITGLALG